MFIVCPHDQIQCFVTFNHFTNNTTRIKNPYERAPLRKVPPKTKGFFDAVYDDAGRSDLSKGYWNPKRKLAVTTHFFRDNKPTIILKKLLNTKHCIDFFFPKLKLRIIRSEKGVVALSFFLDFKNTYQDLILPHAVVMNSAKISLN